MNMSEKKQQMNEMLSASFDAEQSDIETVQIVDALLNDPALKERYIRAQLIDDSLHQQIHDKLIINDLHSRIMHRIEKLPAHFEKTADVVSSSADLKKSTGLFSGVIHNWIQEFLQEINRMLDNKIVSGVSVAASVMFATLFILQYIDTNSPDTVNNNIAASPPIKPSLIQLSSESADRSPLNKHLYQTAEPETKPVIKNNLNINEMQDQDVQEPSYKQTTIEISE